MSRSEVKVTGTRNEKMRHFVRDHPWGVVFVRLFFRSSPWGMVLRQFYASGKISACCLVTVGIDIVIFISVGYFEIFSYFNFYAHAYIYVYIFN